MTLHEAIEMTLRQSGRLLSAREIADYLNKTKWYVKADKSEIMPGQITARINKYPQLFKVDRSAAPSKVGLAVTPTKKRNDRITKVHFQMDESDVAKTSFTSPSKTSLAPISGPDTRILILGSLPGDKSLELSEYYAHPRNTFWRLIATITENPLPVTYPDKKLLLLKTKIGVWDIANSANRKGSLDSAMTNEEPNNLTDFISHHKKLALICFNGRKAEKLFDKYFTRQTGLTFKLLPSTSPANAGMTFENICRVWGEMLSVK